MQEGPIIEYGPLRADEVELAAELYFRAFPERAKMVSSNPSQVAAFGRDWFELMRRACGPTFMAARWQGRLAGFLLLILPGTRLGPALLRDRFGRRLALHALLGRYGFSGWVLRRVLRRLAGTAGLERPQEVRWWPHVDAVVVRPEYAGRGIGSALLRRAREMTEPMYRGISLLVEMENRAAIDVYQRLGFRIVHTRERQHLMVWDFSSSGAEEDVAGVPIQAGRR